MLGTTVFESFPSGDAAGGMVFSVVFASLVADQDKAIFGYSFAALAAIGRMYLFAHHLFDVGVGAGIAFVCTNGLKLAHEWAMGDEEEFRLAWAVVIMVTFMVFYKKVIGRVRKPLPVQYKSKNGEWSMDAGDEDDKKK